jgi:hypothetical protein
MPSCIVRADRSCDTASQTQSATELITQKFRNPPRDAVIRAYDEAGNVIETHEHAGVVSSNEVESDETSESIARPSDCIHRRTDQSADGVWAPRTREQKGLRL